MRLVKSCEQLSAGYKTIHLPLLIDTHIHSIGIHPNAVNVLGGGGTKKCRLEVPTDSKIHVK